MKKITTLLLIAITSACLTTRAQVITDTVSLGGGYPTQVWYSLPNDNQGVQPWNNWDLAIAATASPASPFMTTILFNPKAGSLYEVPGSSSANFAAADTAGIKTWTPLYNSDSTWTSGAFNRTTPKAGYDYGWGSYNTDNHNVEPNRVFVIKYTNGTYKKLYIHLASIDGIYTITYDNLDNSDLQTAPITVASYNTKNFVYYSLTNKAIVDREPPASAWDLIFTQYYEPGSGAAVVTGVLQNHNVSVAEVRHVDKDTYTNYNAHQFDSTISVIGRDWKKLNSSFTGYDVIDSLVYFVKRTNKDIWKVVFTGFEIPNGSYLFTKELVASGTTGIKDNSELSTLSIYPNPTVNQLHVIYDYKNAGSKNTSVDIYDLTGRLVMNQNFALQNGFNQHTVDVSSLSPGIYMVSLPALSNKVQKLVVE